MPHPRPDGHQPRLVQFHRQSAISRPPFDRAERAMIMASWPLAHEKSARISTTRRRSAHTKSTHRSVRSDRGRRKPCAHRGRGPAIRPRPAPPRPTREATHRRYETCKESGSGPGRCDCRPRPRPRALPRISSTEVTIANRRSRRSPSNQHSRGDGVPRRSFSAEPRERHRVMYGSTMRARTPAIGRPAADRPGWSWCRAIACWPGSGRGRGRGLVRRGPRRPEGRAEDRPLGGGTGPAGDGQRPDPPGGPPSRTCWPTSAPGSARAG